MKTAFASPERSPIEEIITSNLLISSFSENSRLMNLIPNIMLVLNNNRQIVYANKAMLNYLNLEESDSILGLRPGELINCVHSDQTEEGCGTTKNCMVCGAARAILLSQEGIIAEEECRILTKSNTALEYKVHCVPLDFGQERFVIFSIDDISDTKRKSVLERIFFHDLLNTAGGIRGFAELLTDADPGESVAFGKILNQLSTKLIDEIQAQQDMISAESNELAVRLQLVNAVEEIQSVINGYLEHPVAEGKAIYFDENTPGCFFETDKRLLSRILSNLLKNALEASGTNDTVSIQCKKIFNHYVFSFHNNQYMPQLVQLQIFKRSFSTKGVGRGLGTYSIKLLTENYLKGRSGFFSDVQNGTTFYVIFPIQ